MLPALDINRLRDRDRYKANGVACTQLPQLPVVGGDNRGWADKTAQRWAVGAENNGHIAGKVHGAKGVGVVVNVGWVHARFAAGGTRPLGLGAIKAYAGAAGVVVYFPVGGKKCFDIAGGKKLRCAVGAVNNAQLPLITNAGF